MFLNYLKLVYASFIYYMLLYLQSVFFLTDMEAALSVRLKDLPLQLKEEIGLYLVHDDLFSLMLTDKNWYAVLSSNYFWRRYVYHHTSLRELDPSLNFRDVYFDHLRNRYKFPVIDMSVVWLNDHYLYKMDYEDCLAGSIVYLSSVCWLDISGSFPDISPGDYEFVWRIMLESHVDVEGTTTITVSYDEKTVETRVKSHHWEQWATKFGHKVWFEIVTGRISVEQKGPVMVHFQNHSGFWKTGIYWDCVHLRPIKKKTTFTAPRQPITARKIGGKSMASEQKETQANVFLR